MELEVARGCTRRENRVSAPRVRQFVLANGQVDITCFARVHRQMQRHDTVATLSRNSMELIVAALRICQEYRVSPCVRQLVLADGLVSFSGDDILHGQVQHGDAITALRSLRGVAVVTLRLIHLSAKRKRSAVTNAVADGIADIILNAEMQYGNAVAKQCGLRGVGVGSGCRQYMITERIVTAVTNAYADGIADVILNSKMQDSHTVATLCGLRGVVIGATCRQRIGA